MTDSPTYIHACAHLQRTIRERKQNSPTNVTPRHPPAFSSPVRRKHRTRAISEENRATNKTHSFPAKEKAAELRRINTVTRETTNLSSHCTAPPVGRADTNKRRINTQYSTKALIYNTQTAYLHCCAVLPSRKHNLAKTNTADPPAAVTSQSQQKKRKEKFLFRPHPTPSTRGERRRNDNMHTRLLNTRMANDDVTRSILPSVP